MALIGSLIVKLAASTSAFEAGMEKARKQAASFGASAVKIGSQVATFGAGVAAAGLAAATALAASSMQSIDNAAKMADQLGLSTEALAGFTHGAGLAGASQEDLTKGLQRFVRQIAEARDGAAGAVGAFSRLGIASDDLNGMGTQQALELVAQRMSEIEDPALRAVAAYEMFGKSGQTLLAFLNQGAAGLQANIAEAEKLGLTYSRIDAAKVEAANDSISRMQAALVGVGNQLAIAVSPSVDAFARRLTEAGTEGERIAKTVRRGMELVALGAAYVADGIDAIAFAFNAARMLGLAFVSGVSSALEAMGNVLAYIPGQVGEQAELSARRYKTFAAEVNAEIAKLSAQMEADLLKPSSAEKVSAFFRQVERDAEASAQAIAANAAAMAKASSAAPVDIDGIEQAEKMIAQVREQIQRLQLGEDAVNIARLQGLGATQEQLNTYKLLLAQQRELSEAAAETAKLEQFAAQVKQDVMTPEQKRIEFTTNLEAALARGLITQDVFNQRMEQLRREAEGAADAVDRMAKTGQGRELGQFEFISTAKASTPQMAKGAGRDDADKALKKADEQLKVQQQIRDALQRGLPAVLV
jgi:hypothetical protein